MPSGCWRPRRAARLARDSCDWNFVFVAVITSEISPRFKVTWSLFNRWYLRTNSAAVGLGHSLTTESSYPILAIHVLYYFLRCFSQAKWCKEKKEGLLFSFTSTLHVIASVYCYHLPHLEEVMELSKRWRKGIFHSLPSSETEKWNQTKAPERRTGRQT